MCASAVQSLASGRGGGDARKAAGRDEGFKGSDEEEGLKEDPSEFPRVPGSHGVPQSLAWRVSHFSFTDSDEHAGFSFPPTPSPVTVGQKCQREI